ncbi:TBC1 domain family member 1 [Papilio xuthus]|uniref:TBC1 domain family member 1 n=1 Tax=Papilio xuthus TaxID=66420 RepID=A0A194PSI5_PAPXU|nr:TBC1 domain family member 1 [Papilio xuthus]
MSRHLITRDEGGQRAAGMRLPCERYVTDLFSQMREPSPGAASPRGSTGSLSSGAVTRNIGFQQTNGSDHLPWTSPAISLPGNCNSNLTNDSSGLVRSVSNASALTSLCADLSPSDSHFFEVLYIGKVRISQRKVPETLIDDALHKFAQHEAEKIKNQRRHSLISSTGTSLYSNSSENIKDDTKSDAVSENVHNRNSNLMTSTTPLEPDKSHVWKSVENLQQTKNHQLVKSESNEIDKEFDTFSKERIEKNTQTRKTSQTPLEPNVLVLNVPTNLGTVTEDEEKSEEIQSVISETASSITQFCQKNFINSNTNSSDNVATDTNPFRKEISEGSNDTKSVHVNDPLLNIPIKISTAVKKTDIDAKSTDNIPDSPTSHDSKTPKPLQLKLNRNNDKMGAMPENKQFLRDRSASIGTLNLKTPIAHLIGEQNRTMLFQVGRSELRLISPDRKQVLLQRAFAHVASCVVGRVHTDHFGFVCRDTSNTSNTSDTYACYVFKCESDSIATELVNAIRQAFVAHAELLKKSREKSPNMTCEHCPLLWYHRLCHDIEGMNEKKTHAFILRRIEQLPEEEQELIVTKYQGGTNHMYEVSEHNAFLMMLLRAHCEAKQQRHVHDTAENRSEFLNQYLGGSTIFMKAKRSLSSGFDHLLKRKASRDENNLVVTPTKKEVPGTSGAGLEASCEAGSGELHPPDLRAKSMSPAVLPDTDSPGSPSIPPPLEEEPEELKDDTTAVNSPMMDIFLKVSDSRPANTEPGSESDATWRQAIYEKATQPPDTHEDELTPGALLGRASGTGHAAGRRSRDQLRQLWRMAIDQTILLVRMEKENARLKESEESSAVRRIKLEYAELGACDGGVVQMWDSLLARDRSHPAPRVDRHMLTQAVRRGVPRVSRGAVWYFLAEQASLRLPPADVRACPRYHTPYRALLASLTKHQHAILIDLGRTFPKHGYFAAALGPGQLALYNILKAYSLLDPEVGYCQGLSFVAGVLLLHMEEAEAFALLRHLMFRRGLRRQYLPDMSALQVQLYQLSRLVRDEEPELWARLAALDVAPALYAAPWMLTLFTSQFPLGFVVRVFDLIFLESLDVVFSVSLALLWVHRDGLLMCTSCEEAAEYLKHKLPDIDNNIYDKVMKKVASLDISRQLSEYAVEYAVLSEEMPRLAALSSDNQRLVADNQRMAGELDSAMAAIDNYEKTQARLEQQNKALEQQLALLSRHLAAQRDLPPDVRRVIQPYAKKLSFSSKIFSNKFASEEDDDPKRNFKTGTSAPNLFSKTSKEEVMSAVSRESTKSYPDADRRHFMMKKSQSIHSGLIAPRNYAMKVLDEKPETQQQFRSEILSESLRELGRKSSGFFANTHEQIRQERLFERQLKHDFDENLKKPDPKLTPTSYLDDLNLFQSRKSMSLNLTPSTKVQETKSSDSGFVTPLSPAEAERREERGEEVSSVVSHPLSDCDVDIKFDGQSTKLKQIRPLRPHNRAL